MSAQMDDVRNKVVVFLDLIKDMLKIIVWMCCSLLVFFPCVPLDICVISGEQ